MSSSARVRCVPVGGETCLDSGGRPPIDGPPWRYPIEKLLLRMELSGIDRKSIRIIEVLAEPPDNPFNRLATPRQARNSTPRQNLSQPRLMPRRVTDSHEAAQERTAMGALHVGFEEPASRHSASRAPNPE